MSTTRLTSTTTYILKILHITAQAYGIPWHDSSKTDPRILASEFKDPIKLSN